MVCSVYNAHVCGVYMHVVQEQECIALLNLFCLLPWISNLRVLICIKQVTDCLSDHNI